ncbi:hypothetical protein BC939DRAFT_474955 [Gamsiella multidivaricata]|uniref:uncharacterized protein n=1 Tax=Gamsiella multidivaricata TaxID=101098 RepID=UPI002220BA04|nr:uncharacterized protein BC939DRAFT_474955 [Gamsiella multidivaricata]KAI7828236.1 hypothetical protein BC939DRAFT_474955 [Gamsiella multidivaricata]
MFKGLLGGPDPKKGLWSGRATETASLRQHISRPMIGKHYCHMENEDAKGKRARRSIRGPSPRLDTRKGTNASCVQGSGGTVYACKVKPARHQDIAVIEIDSQDEKWQLQWQWNGVHKI